MASLASNLPHTDSVATVHLGNVEPFGRASLGWNAARLVILLGALIVGAVTAGTALIIASNYTKTVEEAKTNLMSLALVLGDQVERSFQSVEVVQNSAVQRLRDAKLNSTMALTRLVATHEWHDVLKGWVDISPNIHALAILDDAGNLINTSEVWPNPTINLAEWDYFKTPFADPTMTTFISNPAVDKLTGEWIVVIARRLTSPNGLFIGLLTASILLSDLEGFYHHLSGNDQMAIALLRRDGILLARYPRADGALGKINVRNSAIFNALESTSSVVLRQRSLVDGLDRFIAARALDKFPLVVSAGGTVSGALASWRHETIQMMTVAALTDLAVGMAGFLGLRQIRTSEKLVRNASRLARHDTLTGLPNRLFFNEHIQRLAIEFAQQDRRLSVLIVDLDQFKEVNDTLGHPVGDALLKAVGERLQSFLQPQDVVARLGGDEFAIIRIDPAGAKDIEAFAAKLISGFSEPFIITDHRITIGISIGAALLPEDGYDPSRLLRRADLALYRSKSSGRQVFHLFEQDMETQFHDRRALEVDFRRAVAQRGFELVYQPLLNLRSNRIEGFETLLRWKHPDRGYIPPHDFISLAEDTGLIGQLGDWVLSTACAQAAGWPAFIKLAVNLSPLQFKTRDVVDDVKKALEASRLPASRLELEITESVQLEDNNGAGEALHQLRALGISVVLDDFGTGYSSLSYLRKFPFDKLKIDRSFVEEMETSSGCAAIVKTTLMLAHQLGMKTTAEGVEKLDQLKTLRLQGCTHVQGFLISEPVAPEKVLSLLNGKTTCLGEVA